MSRRSRNPNSSAAAEVKDAGASDKTDAKEDVDGQSSIMPKEEQPDNVSNKLAKPVATLAVNEENKDRSLTPVAAAAQAAVLCSDVQPSAAVPITSAVPPLQPQNSQVLSVACPTSQVTLLSADCACSPVPGNLSLGAAPALPLQIAHPYCAMIGPSGVVSATDSMYTAVVNPMAPSNDFHVGMPFSNGIPLHPTCSQFLDMKFAAGGPAKFKVCSECGATQSPKWRNRGKLCNACGLVKFKKQKKNTMTMQMAPTTPAAA